MWLPALSSLLFCIFLSRIGKDEHAPVFKSFLDVWEGERERVTTGEGAHGPCPPGRSETTMEKS